MLKKIIAGVSLSAFAMMLAGCGNESVPAQDSMGGQVQNKQTNEQMVEDSSSQRMPEATGKVDDTVNAIIDGANSESAQALSNDEDAVASVGDGQEINNLNTTYDENAL